MKLRSTAIALGVGAATAAGLSLLKVDKPVVIGSTAVVIGAGLIVSKRKSKDFREEGNREDSPEMYATRLSNLLLEFWEFTPFANNNPIPVGLASKNEDETINISFCLGTKEDPDRSKESCFYRIDHDGNAHVEVEGVKEVLNLNDMRQTFAVIYTIISDIYGEYNVNEVMNNYMRVKVLKDTSKESLSDPSYFYERGEKRFEKMYYEEAISDYSQAIRIDPNYLLALFKRGLSNYNLCNFDEAIDDFNKTIEIDPKHVKAYFYSAYSKYQYYYDKKNYENAIEDAKKVIELDPNFSDAYELVGDLLTCLGDQSSDSTKYAESLRYFDKAIETSEPDRANVAHYSRARAREKLKDYEGALSDYWASHKYGPRTEIASTLYHLGRYQEAIDLISEDIEERIKTNMSPLEELHEERARCKKALGDEEGAAKDIMKAKEALLEFRNAQLDGKYDDDEDDEIDDKTRISYLLECGAIRKELGDLKGACEDWKKAAELGDEDAAELLKEHCK